MRHQDDMTRATPVAIAATTAASIGLGCGHVGGRFWALAESDDEDDDERGGESLPPIRKKDRIGLVPLGSAPAPRRSADAPPAPEPLEADPSSRLSGFKFGRRLLEPASDDQ